MSVNFFLSFEKGIKCFFSVFLLAALRASFFFSRSLFIVVLVISLTEIHFLKVFEDLAGYVNFTLYLQVRKFLLSTLAGKTHLLLHNFFAVG